MNQNDDTSKKELLKNDDFIGEIYNNFDPFFPLPPYHPAYVDCKSVRGDENIIVEIGKSIVRSKQSTCQLYAGHRGGGKSTELLRLKDYLEQKGCYVIYFSSDEDLDLENVRYTDILLACTRRIVEDLQNRVKTNALIKWLQDKAKELKGFLSSDIDIEGFELEQQLSPFTKIVANIKTSPDNREKIRKQLEEDIVNFTQALNEFIDEAKKNLPNEKSKLVVIVDNLDRIPISRNSDGSNNHDEIFIDHNVQLRSLNCHVVYTVPISLVYSNRAANLRDHYGDTEVLPMIMIKDKQDTLLQAGIDKIKQIIQCRIKYITEEFTGRPDISLSLLDIFDGEETINQLCQMTGGHVREVMFLVQEALNKIDTLPITYDAVKRAIATSRNTYNNTVDHEDWDKLAEVALSKKVFNDDEYRLLLFNRCVLEYREVNSQKTWHDVHPLIRDIDEFIDVYNQKKR